jgi:hypothetical protein
MRSWDFRLFRHFKVNEHAKLEMTFDAFNMLNRPNVEEVITVYAAPVFIGPVPQHYKDGTIAPNPAFGQPGVMANPRQLQFAMKVSF